jgi:hypothetical protein
MPSRRVDSTMQRWILSTVKPLISDGEASGSGLISQRPGESGATGDLQEEEGAFAKQEEEVPGKVKGVWEGMDRQQPVLVPDTPEQLLAFGLQGEGVG